MPRGVSQYDEASLQGRLWSPQELRPLIWLDASDVSTISVSTGVSEWRDKSGNGLHVSQATAANQPSLLANGINGIQAIDWGTTANAKSLTRGSLSGYSPARYYGVADYDGTYGASAISSLISHNFTANQDLFALAYGFDWYAPTTNKAFLNGGESSSGTAGPTTSDPFIFGTDMTPSSSRTNVYIGQDRTFTDRSWLGKIGEVIALSAVPNSREKALLEGYLAWKWRIANLRSTHPFYNRPPLIGD